VRKSNWKEHLAANGKVASQRDIKGERKPLEAKTSMQFFPGDVVNMVVQNGGGYGDPIRREPARVREDVLNGAVTEQTARGIYGVVLDKSGMVDSDATASARDGIRRKRLSDAKLPGKASSKAAASGTATLRWGDAIKVQSGKSSLTLRCGSCNEPLGGSSGNWREAAALRNPAAAELGPHIQIDDRFIFEQLICPHCATSLWVDTRNRDDVGVIDFKLA
jgi:N-methylhydantoinase B